MEDRYIPKLAVYDYDIADFINGILINKDFDRTMIKDIILRQHDMIFNYNLFFGPKRDSMQKLIINETFLDCLNDLAAGLRLTEVERICLNKIVFDYLRLPDKIQSITDKLLSIAYQVNATIENIFYMLDTTNDKKILSIVVQSDFDKLLVAHRINAFLATCETNMRDNIATIVSLYTVVVQMGFIDVYSLITGTMLEKEDDTNPKIYLAVSKALIEVIETIAKTPSENITLYTILYNYGVFIQSHQIPKTRFSMKKDILDPVVKNIIISIESNYPGLVCIP